MHVTNILEKGLFKEKNYSMMVVHESPYMKLINFNFEAGQELPIHRHDIEGELAITVLEGEGFFLGADDAAVPAKAGDVLTCEIAQPHGIRAASRMRVLVCIAPPI